MEQPPQQSATTALPAPFKRTALHRVCWDGADPETGDYLLAPGGRAAYRIVQITVLHRNALLTTPRLRLDCWSCSAQHVPEDATVHAWTRTVRAVPSAEQRAEVTARIRAAKALQAHEAIVRARAVGSDDGHVAAVRRQAGSVAPVVAARWDDPADTNERSRKPWQVHGHRTRDGLRNLREQGIITEAQWAAADLFRTDLEVTRGARPQLDEVRVDICTTRSYDPPDYLLKATGRVREAWQIAIGIVASSVVVAVVVIGQPLDGFASEQGWDAGRARDVLIGALDRLATLYATTDRERRQGSRTRIDAVHQTPVLADEAPSPPDPVAPPEASARPSRTRPVSDEPFVPWMPPVVTRAAVSSAVARLMALGSADEPDGPPAG